MVGGHAGINTSLNPRVGKELQNQRMDRYKWIGHSLRPYPLSVFAMYLDLILLQLISSSFMTFSVLEGMLDTSVMRDIQQKESSILSLLPISETRGITTTLHDHADP